MAHSPLSSQELHQTFLEPKSLLTLQDELASLPNPGPNEFNPHLRILSPYAQF